MHNGDMMDSKVKIQFYPSIGLVKQFIGLPLKAICIESYKLERNLLTFNSLNKI